MPHVSILALIVATVASFMLGGLWYSPLLFAKAWTAASGVDVAAGKKKGPVYFFGTAILLSLVEVYTFAMFLGPGMETLHAALYGFVAGLCWVSAGLWMTYVFEMRPAKLWLINGGYATVQFTLIGLILGLLNK